MNLLRMLYQEDIEKFSYFMGDKLVKKYKQQKIAFACIPLLALISMVQSQDFSKAVFIPVAMLIFSKLPYLFLNMKHTQNCNDVVSAIPLWVNQIYALIESNNIHNAIKNSLTQNTPPAIYNDLKKFIAKIEKDTDDRQAYLDFLARYNIDGFAEIMLKLYEFRKLSKSQLKYEIRQLNVNLNKIEIMKRQAQFKNEVFFGDTCTCFIIFIPCMYMTLISLLPSLFSM